MDSEELDKLWKDPTHWSVWWYNCKADPRIIVPKRNPVLGWTINAGHPKAGITIFMLFVLSVIFPLGVVALDGVSFMPAHFFLAIMVSGASIISACFYLSRKN